MANENVSKLFGEFPPVTTEQWEEKIKIDLKGADYEKKLVWRTPEGFPVQPYYRKEDLEDKEYLDVFPGDSPYVRGNVKSSNDWEIRQDIRLDDVEVANKKALFVLDRGITSLGFVTEAQKGKMAIESQADFTRLMKDIHMDCIGLYFVSGHNGPEIVKMIHSEVKSKGLNPEKIMGGVNFDPLGYLSISGSWGESEDKDFDELKRLIEYAAENLPNYNVLGIGGCFYTNAGATVVQELAYTLSMANEYICKLNDMGVDVDTILDHLQVNLGVGSSYFMEIAKIRAMRLLWAKMVEAHKPRGENQTKVYIHSVTAKWNNTIYDPYVNILRATTESMAAVVGGTDSLTVKPFDLSYRPTTKFSGRLSRNIQIILKEEAYLDKIVDPSAGSYYIENLTDSIIKEAWKLFLDIEDKGGYLQALKDGIIQEDIEATASKRANNIATRREILLGTNQFPNFNEGVKEEVDIDIAFPKTDSKEGAVKAIRKFRGAEEFEKLRLATENHKEGIPKVFMLTMGNLTMRKARATFSCNFFACAGYEVIDNLGFKTVEEGVQAALNAKADIVVVCSSDDEYVELVPAVAGLLKDKAEVVVAGAPKCMEELQQKGIQHFIHVRSNVLETLKGFHKILGIN